jgi:hypothetical protein
VALVAHVGQSLLTAHVSNARILLELFQFYIQGAFAIEKVDRDGYFITRVAPSNLIGIFEANEIGPILRPVF